ncbi:sulfurtransferase TusA family protein [bacterium]|nr:sulfurtransferase TusA family protein [bacterium]
MPVDSKLNLIGVISPVCLLECKKAMKSLKSGGKITILLDDKSVVSDLITIVKRSQDQILGVTNKTDHCQISIQKG